MTTGTTGTTAPTGPTVPTAPTGGYDDHARERLVREPAKSPHRTAFARDRARVLHASALRRLAAKTQVVGPDSDDFVRNRLTHSLEVAQVGRELGASLGCDPDVVEAACLAHDLGHPPFGHTGESVLDALSEDIGGFEGNAQTLRVLTRLEPKVTREDGGSAGLNLTRASLDAATKYPWARGEQPEGGPAGKFGVYADDLEVFRWLREGAEPGARSIEAQVMDLADDVAYSVHDVEDGVVADRLDLGVLRSAAARAEVTETAARWYGVGAGTGEVEAALLRLQSLPEWVEGFDGSRRGLAALKTMTSALIGRFVGAAHEATRARHGDGPLTRHAAGLLVPTGTLAEVVALKAVAAHYVMGADERLPVYAQQQEVLTELVDALLTAGEQVMQPPYAADLADAVDDDAALRVVVDQVAALTDTSAVVWHRSLVG